MITAETLVGIMNKKGQGSKDYRLGTIDYEYRTGRPRIIFDGEDEVSEKTYMKLMSYTPKGGDRVLMLKVADTFIILGGVE